LVYAAKWNENMKLKHISILLKFKEKIQKYKAMDISYYKKCIEKAQKR